MTVGHYSKQLDIKKLLTSHQVKTISIIMAIFAAFINYRRKIFIDVRSNQLSMYFDFYIYAFIGIFLVFCLAYNIKNKIVRFALKSIGENTLPILAFHMYIYRMFVLALESFPPHVFMRFALLLIFPCSIILPILFGLLIKRIDVAISNNIASRFLK